MRQKKDTAPLRVVQPQREVDGDEDAEEAIAVDGWKPLLPEGIWLEAKYIGRETARIFNTAKVFLHFEIVEPGEHFGVRLFRAFRVRMLTTRPGKNGGLVLHSNGELYSLLVRLLDIKLRSDRPSFRALRRMLFRIRTRTVKTDHRQRSIPEQSRYTVIEDIEREQ